MRAGFNKLRKILRSLSIADSTRPFVFVFRVKFLRDLRPHGGTGGRRQARPYIVIRGAVEISPRTWSPTDFQLRLILFISALSKLKRIATRSCLF